MRLAPAKSLIVGLSLILVACGDSEGTGDSSGDPVPADLESDSAPPPPSDTVAAELAAEAIAGATPMEERVATIGLLNKRNNVSEDLEMRPGETREVGPVIVTLSACERTAPWEMPRETGAFVQVDVLERGQSDHTRVFSGWLFKESPSINVVEHPIYDVWVKDCAMSFPGEE